MEYSDDGKYLMMAGSKTAQIMDTTTEPYVNVASKSVSNTASVFRAGGFVPYTTDLVLVENHSENKTDVKLYDRNLTALKSYGKHTVPYTASMDRLGTKFAIAKSGTKSDITGLCVYDIDTAESDSGCSNITDKLFSCTFDYSGRYIMCSLGAGNGGTPKCYDTSTNPYTEVSFESILDIKQTPHSEYHTFFSTKGNEYLFFRNTDKKLVCYDMRTVPFRYVEDFPEITHTVDGIVARRDLKEFMVLYTGGKTHTFLKSY